MSALGAVWLHFLGLIGVTHPGYWQNFWEGFGSGPIAWCILPGTYYIHHMCHDHGCYRIGHPKQDGSVACKKHLSKESS